MESGHLDPVECPICLEIPEQEIFQCRNGHTICSQCEGQLGRCPQCQVGLEMPSIRNRSLEHLLDKMKFDCGNKSLGCTSKLTRSQIFIHRKSCQFGWGICEAIGFSSGYTVSIASLSEAIQHFKNNHNFHISTCTDLDLSLEDFKDNSIIRNSSMWTPVLVDQLAAHDKIIVIMALLNDDDQTMSFNCLEFGEGETRFKVTFNINATDNAKNSNLVWSSIPTHPVHALSSIAEPLMRYPVRQLQQNYTHQASLLLKFSLRESTEFAKVNIIRNPETLELQPVPKNPNAVKPPSPAHNLIAVMNGTPDPVWIKYSFAEIRTKGVPPDAVLAGADSKGNPVYVCRALVKDGQRIPGSLVVEQNAASAYIEFYGSQAVAKDFEVLTYPAWAYSWVQCDYHFDHKHCIVGGTENKADVCIGRALVMGGVFVGKWLVSQAEKKRGNGFLYLAYGSESCHVKSGFQCLVRNNFGTEKINLA